MPRARATMKGFGGSMSFSETHAEGGTVHVVHPAPTRIVISDQQDPT